MSRGPPPLPSSFSASSSSSTPLHLHESDDDDDVPPPPPASVQSDDFGPPPPPPPPEEVGTVDLLTGATPQVSPPPIAGRPSAASISGLTTPSRGGSISSVTSGGVTTTRNPLGSIGGVVRAASSSSSAAPPPPRSARSSAADSFPPAFPRAPSVSAASPLSSPYSAASPAASPSSLSLSAPLHLEDDGFASPTAQSASQLTAAQDLGSAKSFASSLTHNFLGVSAQVEIGSYAAKRCASFLKKMALAQEEYSRNISKLLLHEQTKLAKLSGDHMGVANKTWLAIQEIYARVAKNHLAEAAEVSLQVVAPLVEFHVAQEERRKEILQEERKISLEMAKAREEVSKGLVACTRLLDEAKKLQAEANEDRKTQASGEKTGFFKSLSMKVGRKPETVLKEAGKAASTYQTSILTANKRQARYLEQDLPKLFGDMQSLEKRRLDTTKQRLLKFHSTAASFAAERAAMMDELKKAVDLNNSTQDIKEFIEEMLYEHGPSHSVRQFSYELPCTPNDIESGRLEGSPNSIFRATLEHCMELQRASTDAAASRMDIPRILPTLITRIRELGGYTELGIFRISVGKDDLDALRKQIDIDGNYNVANVKNAHICAALLKEWLRLLAEPLIPTEVFYQQAIDSVKGSSGASFNPALIMKLYDNLPVLNQKILRELSLMVRDISEPTNAEKSKMNVENLAIGMTQDRHARVRLRGQYPV
jgi:hypothetical protein